jgi:hypothetical protein
MTGKDNVHILHKDNRTQITAFARDFKEQKTNIFDNNRIFTETSDRWHQCAEIASQVHIRKLEYR